MSEGRVIDPRVLEICRAVDEAGGRGVLVGGYVRDRLRGEDPKDLFKNAAKALMHLMIEGESKSEASDMNITVSGQDLPDLLVRWLGEILYLFEGEGLVVTSIYIDFLSLSRLDAALKIVPFDPTVHEIISEIKAVTYHQTKVMDKGSFWEAQVIFDT